MDIEHGRDRLKSSQSVQLKSFAAKCIEKYECLLQFAGKCSESYESWKVLRSIVIPSINGNSLFFNQRSGKALSPPLFPSFVTDDHSSFEYSLSFTMDQVNIRLLFEPLPLETHEEKNGITMNDLHKASLQTYLTVLDYMNKSSGEKIKMDFEKLQSLFIKTNNHFQTLDRNNPFSIWYAVDLKVPTPLFKAYFNLISFYNSSSKLQPSEAVRMGLNIMGIQEQASKSLLDLIKHLDSRASLVFFSIDLNSPILTRCKIYVRFYDVSVDQLEDIASITTNYQKGTISEFVQHFLPRCHNFRCQSSPNSTSTVGPVITFVFDSSNEKGPDSLKFHLPIRHYLSSEEKIAQLIQTYLKKKELFYPNQRFFYEQTIANYKTSKSNRSGCQTYVAFSSSKLVAVKEFTVYLSPQLYSSDTQVLAQNSIFQTPKGESSNELHTGAMVNYANLSNTDMQNDLDWDDEFDEIESSLPKYAHHSVKFLTKTSMRERKYLLESVQYNIFSFPAKYVLCDFLSDSGTGALTSLQYSAMFLNDEAYGRNNGYYCLLDSLRDVLERGDHPRLAINLFTQLSISSDEILSFLSENRRGGFVNSGVYQLTNPNTFIVPQGRCAELLLFSTLRMVIEQRNVETSASNENRFYVLSNGLFDTTEAHIKTNGFIPMNLFSPKLNEPFHPKEHLQSNPFKGDIDIDLLKQCIEKYPRHISLIVLTITNNTAAGQPVALSNIRTTSEICRAANIPLMIDACRFAENAAFIKKYEFNYSQKSIREIVAEIFSYADVVTISLKKDGMSNIGGVLMFKDSSLFDKIYSVTSSGFIGHLLKERQILYFGNDSYGGLSGREIMCCAVGIQQVLDEDYLNNRLSQAAYFADQLVKNGIPVVLPTGGHAVYLDMKSFLGPLYREEKFQGLGFCIELLIRFGIRSFDSGTFSYCWDLKNEEERKSMLHWVRLAIPRNTYNQQHFDYAVRAIRYLFHHKSHIPSVIIVRGKTLTLRHFAAGFELIYGNNSESDNSVADDSDTKTC